MTSRDLEAIVRSVIIERGLPFDLLAVASSPPVWEIRLRHKTGGIVSVTVPDGRPVAVRVAIQEHLEDAI
jgi:hypothetical protein